LSTRYLKKLLPTCVLVSVCLVVCVSGCAIRRVPPIRYIPLLGSRVDTSVEGILREALKDKNLLVRRDAVRLLGSMAATPEEQRRSAEALEKALNDKEEDIRLEAVKALGKMAPEISGPYLRKAVKDKSVRVRIQVIQALRELHQRQSSQVQSVTGG
jgi:hypothetical protein